MTKMMMMMMMIMMITRMKVSKRNPRFASMKLILNCSDTFFFDKISWEVVIV